MAGVTPIGPGPESVSIALYAPDPDGAKWDRSTWDGGTWASLDWRDVGCEVGEASYRWGATDEAGILTVAAAGGLDLGTIDPDRVLDPLNTQSPFYGSIRPGTPVRITGTGLVATIASTTIIDECSYDMASARGRIRAIDGLAYLAQAQVPDGAVLPNTLRARVRAVVNLVGLAGIIPVEPEDPTDPDVDPPVAPFAGKSAPAWAVISDAAQDALTYVWLGPTGKLRFRSFGAFPDASISIGCPDDASLGDQWLEGLSTILTSAGADAVRNTVRAWTATDTYGAAVQDGPSIAKYGPRPLDAPRIVPNAAVWAGRILADRADAGLDIGVGEVRPYTPLELDALLGAMIDGPALIRVRDDAHGEVVDIDVSLLGATVGITPAGWRFALVSAISRVEWDNVTPPPPEPPIPPPNPYHTETRTYVASSDALLALTSGNAKYGAGAANSLPVGTWQGWTYRACIAFPGIPWTKVRAVKSATLHLRTTNQVRIGFGSSPTIEARRITESWSAGSSSSPSSGNAVVYPGPGTTTSGAVRANVTKSEQTDVAIRIDAIARAWAPASIGGSGAAQRGVMLLPGSGSGADTTELWPVEQGGAARPSIDLVLEVFD